MDLPLHPQWTSTNDYVESLLGFVTASALFQNLCGGVHVLDFLTREPDIYASVLPQEWREWFEEIDVHDLLQILLRTEIGDQQDDGELRGVEGQLLTAIPESLREYIFRVRIHTLQREFSSGRNQNTSPEGSSSSNHLPMPRHVSVGMKPKKMHEVSNFASFVASLSRSLEKPIPTQAGSRSGTADLKVVDFGSGQNYLGRTLASPPYNRHVIAIERKHHNVDGARGLDIQAKLVKKEKIMRNKKEYKRQLAEMASGMKSNGILTPPPSDLEVDSKPPRLSTGSEHVEPHDNIANHKDSESDPERGSMTHIEHDISSGEIESVVYSDLLNEAQRDPLMTVSLHSCGNLTHHALRSILNPSVRCVAAIGCCYNLMTERLGPATYKHPELHRSLHPRLVATSTAYDPQGFPMSRRLEEYTWTSTADAKSEDTTHSDEGSLSPREGRGIRMNITARMMAVQAPGNWGREDSEMFFTRHFYRALLQKILLDCGVVKQGRATVEVEERPGADEANTPLIVGSLRKAAFDNFEAYVKAALGKLIANEEADAQIAGKSIIKAKTAHLTSEMIQHYEREYAHRRKHLAVMWSLMAFSAGVVESLIVLDRWLWLKEQSCVERAWVRTVFDYGMSPRNLCVVGMKRKDVGGGEG
ncbi:Methyltransferase-like protein 25 [Cyphellophora attinorum]|uniref:Methyltransferase-like protein 25 n=1 Tax=Cyphellophora attinorum TaxID=1664694 RepID=A0A0N0NKF3_9EURO|nr:Methyltransferase-like protein 25 [Phialophora attinorum]KPI37968.1 Methyltransferase-like protein 25 [Phialophora attinorum]